MIRTKTELVNTIGQLRLSCMSGSGKKVSVQVCIPERAQWIDYQGIRIQVQDPVYMAGEKMGSQQAVIHFFGIGPGDRGVCKGGLRNLDREKGKAKNLTLSCDRCQVFSRNPAVQEIKLYRGIRLIYGNGSKQDLQPWQVCLVECSK